MTEYESKDPPSAEEQVKFLAKMQRLLSEGSFTATYKFALLMSIADLAVERGEDSGHTLLLPLDAISEKFILYYWGQTKPYVPLSDTGFTGGMLRQNTSGQAAILSRLEAFQSEVTHNINVARNHIQQWERLVRDVKRTICTMPLWRLQTVGDQLLDFLYPDRYLIADSIELRPGVAYCLRRFHSLVLDLVRGAWLTYIRRYNQEVLGTSTDLDQFLFGTQRRSLQGVTKVLLELQAGRCFYCQRNLQAKVDIDHFVPWSRYAVDLGHNFVAAHDSCNRSKSDHIAALEHLEPWFRRSIKHETRISEAIGQAGFVCDLKASLQVVRWAYEQAEVIGERGWVKGTDLSAIGSEWREILGIR